ncbi:MAG: UDP-N-acetylglucosamine 2-epimerase (non-hydrolyzing) [Pseudomonadota bacterium]
MKIVTVVGARPQFIKVSSVSREICRRVAGGDSIREVIVHTGQHFDANMSRIFFDEMGIPKPRYNLNVGGTSHGAMTGKMIEKLEEVLILEKPDIVLLYGDTNSTLAGAIVASKLNIRIAHVEAGMRSFNWSMPEEKNRVLTDRVSQLLFCSTETAMVNLEQEGIANWGNQVLALLSGDVMMDSALYYRETAIRPEGNVPDSDYILCTIHRAENTDQESRLIEILAALSKISVDKTIVLPVHPRTRAILENYASIAPKLILLPAVGYLNMVWLLKHCEMVITDSGGLQKEAFFFEKPCITLRNETEWVELVDNGFNFLSGASSAKILDVYHNAEFNSDFEIDLYGTGNASAVIVDNLVSYCTKNPG